MTKPAGYPTRPSHLWERFYEITRVPRPSKKEEKMTAYLVDVAKEAGLEYKVDKVNNVVIYLPGTEGYEDHAPVIIQSHMDMVCDKTPEKIIDFENDPIEMQVKDGWIFAKDTTLGADNGFGCAAALALINNSEAQHPPLELLFTVDEETGLNGALNLEPEMYKGRKLINIDTEEWGSVYIGCAGGIDFEMEKNFEMSKATKGLVPYKIELSGLKGGHSGLDIARSRGNAIKLLNQILWDMKGIKFELSSVVGGRAHNIIPREAYTIIYLDKSDIDNVRDICSKKIEEYKTHLPQEDLGVEFIIQELGITDDRVFSEFDKKSLLTLLNLFPHGAYSYNWESTEPLVNYSNNLAVFKAEAGKLYAETSVRFFERNEISELEQKLEALTEMFGIKLIKGCGYPSWKPDFKNELLEVCKDVYENMFGKQAQVKAIHAGLECGILKDKLGEMDAISIGPNLKSVHSPTECLEISSSQEFWKLFLGLLKRL